MRAFEIDQLIAEQAAGERPYLEFLRHDSMSLGVYALPAGGHDPQQPHHEDEVYYVVSGQGQVTVGEETQPVQPGSIVFVAAHVPHHFHDITEDLKILVFFAPAETN
jgi:mannose-6-phosphate isomerase-like protein (cupin superfamily)